MDERDQESRTIGAYQIRGKLGAGGMGEVYRAHDPRLQRDVALKILSVSEDAAGTSSSGGSSMTRLLREARSAAGLNHPNICTVYEVGEANGQAYIAMELIDGEPLSVRLADGPLAPEQVVRYASQLADALCHAHERSVIHRDLKSANIVVTSEGQGRAKILDFGLAKRVQEADASEGSSVMTATRPGTVMGTLAYMAPEQLRGGALDERCDIWAFGVVLYEMLVGKRPFQGATGFELSNAILSAAPEPFPAHTPLGLRAVIERCLAKEPGRRYQRASDVRAALEALEAPSPTTWPGWSYVLNAVSRRGRALLAASAVLVLSAAAWIVVQALFEPSIDSIVVLPFANLSGDPEQEFLADGVTTELIAELTKLQGLSVVSRTSAMRLKNTDQSMGEIVRDLRVDAAIEGGIVRDGDVVRATISLIDGSTETSLWGESFEEEASGIMALNRKMALAIAGAVDLTLSAEEEALLASGIADVDPEAYEAYLKGRMHWYKQSPMDVDRALQYFELAVEKDPNFALAHLGMGYVWIYYASAGLMPPGEMGTKLMESVRRARDIDPTLAETFEGEADYLFYYDWEWERAGELYEKAIELRPNSADMRLYYWEYLVAMNRPDEAREQIERCVELDPFNSYVQVNYGMYFLSTHQFEAAVEQFQEVLKLDMDFGPALLALGQAYHHLGREDDAFASIREFYFKWGDDEMVDVLDEGFQAGGYRRAMLQAAQALEARSEYRDVLAISVALFFAYAGEKERALDWLEKAHEKGESGLVKLQVDPDWDSLRDEPRFQELMAKMNFPPS